MIEDFLQVHEDLKSLKQFCARASKQPYVYDNAKGRLVPYGWQIDSEKWLTFDQAIQFYENGTEVYHKNTPWKVEGIGILIVGNGKDEPQLLGGDLDCVRDPETGILSEWAKKILTDIQPFYAEISPSNCGIRFFVMGRLPNELKQITAFGPQNDLSKETIKRIIKIKPVVLDKMVRGEPALNGIEFHESSGLYKDTGKYSAKHLTITGWKLSEYCYAKEDRTAAIAEAMKDLVEEKSTNENLFNQNTNEPVPEWAKEMDETIKKYRLPPLDIVKVIGRIVDLSMFYESGGQLLGPHPLGSTSGHNLVINPLKNTYAYMRPSPPVGGDPWIWLAHECGASPWEAKGEGLLKDRTILERTINYAIKQKIISESEAEAFIKEPEIRTVSIEDEIGTIGKHKDNTVRQVSVDDKGNRTLKWISDISVILHTQTQEDDIKEFTFTGVGARDGTKATFTTLAFDMSDHRKFRGLLINAFGGENRVGTLTFEMVQGITRNQIKKQRITVPVWRDNLPLVPGLDNANDVEFRLSPLTPASVYDGDINAAKGLLKRFMMLRKYTSILMTVVLGAPVFARWFPRDRFGAGTWGLSGSNKTTLSKMACTVYGVGFYDDHALIKHGKNGATQVGAMEALFNAGILPRIIDDVKATDQKDVQGYIALIHAVIEGGEKLRGRKDNRGLRETKAFLTTPIITGEIRPNEASTSARVLNLAWPKCNDSPEMTSIQEDISLMPVIGYHWLKFLSTIQTDIRKGFEEARTKKYNEYIPKNYVNTGRLASMYCLIRLIWNMGKQSPFAEVFEECEKPFLAALDEAIENQAHEVNDETEVAKFLAALNELVTTRPDLFMFESTPTGTNKILGRINKNGLFVFPNEILAEMKQLGIFTQVPNVSSLTNALLEEGVIVRSKSKDHKLYQTKINNNPVRGWLFKDDWNSSGYSESATGNDSNQNNRGDLFDFKKDQKMPSVPETQSSVATGDSESIAEDANNRKTEKTDENIKCLDGYTLKHLNNDMVTTVNTVTNIDNNVIDIDSSLLDKSPVSHHSVAENTNENINLDPSQKQKLWETVGQLLRKYPRIEKGKKGVILEDLFSQTNIEKPKLESILKVTGWESSKVEASGLIIYYAPEKVLKAYGIEAKA